jgi:hypothetical protein
MSDPKQLLEDMMAEALSDSLRKKTVDESLALLRAGGLKFPIVHPPGCMCDLCRAKR